MRPNRRPLVALGLLVALVGVGFGRPSATAGAATCAQTTADHVAVVIDFGTLAGAPPGLATTCVVMPERANGIDALRAAAPGPIATDNSGKVCAIGGYPANPSSTNCSTPHDGRIRYWAYFLGTDNGWEYSAAGAAAVRVRPDVVQGWRYLDVSASGGTAGIVPPRDALDGRRTALWSSTCPALSAPTTQATAPPSTGAPMTSVPGVGGTPPPSGPGSTGTGRAPDATRSPTATGPTTTAVPRGTTSLANGAITGLQSTGRAKLLTPAEVRSATAAAPSRGSQLGVIVGIVVGVLVVAVLLALVAWRSRRRLARA